jgi:membrane protease YdiL (CAAX protease family)
MSADPDQQPPVPSGPPGSGVFTLEGRRAPGLYLVAWVLSVMGLALLFVVGPLASSQGGRAVIVIGGGILLLVGLSAACGYQVVERRERPESAYRGPSPLLLFATYLCGVLILLTLPLGAADPADPLGYLAIGTAQALAYAVAVWLFVVRTGALSWRAMGWPTWQGRGLSSLLRAGGIALLVMLPTMMVALLLSGLLSQLLGVEAPNLPPSPRDAPAALAILLTAALVLPIGEELFFRGFAATAWLRDLGPRAALLRSTVFFALVHIASVTSTTFGEGAAQALLLTTVLLPVGYVLGWLFLRWGMAAAIVGHVTYNGVQLLLWLAIGQSTV